MVKGEDADLVKLVLAGNPDDFRKLVEKYQHEAERWAFHHVRNFSDAESVAQEALVEAYFRLDTLDDHAKFGSWLHSIVNNTAISRLRRRRRTVSFEQINSVHSDENLFERHSRYEVAMPDDVLERQEQEQLLQAAISKLPQTYQRAVIMFYFDSCSHREIADRLDTSVSAVKSMLHRARQNLRKEMTGDG